MMLGRDQSRHTPKLSTLRVAQNGPVSLRVLAMEALLHSLGTTTLGDHIPTDLVHEMIERLLLSRTATGAGLTQILSTCPDLQSLNLSHSSFGPKTLEKIGLLCPVVSKLNLANCKHLPSQTLIHIFAVAKNLKELNLNFLPHVDDACLQGISESCPQLNSLWLHNTRNFSDAGLSSVLQRCTNLHTLEIKEQPRINKSIEQLAAFGNQLQVLVLKNCLLLQGESLVQIAENCHNLVVFNIKNCKNVDSEHILNLDCPNLKKLNLDFCRKKGDVKFVYIPCSTVQCIIKRTTGLTSLNIHYLKYTEEEMHQFISEMKSPLLTLKTFNGSHRTSDRVLAAIANSLPDLQVLYLGAHSINEMICEQISDVGIELLSTNLSLLKTLYISQCAIGDEAISHISKNLKSLEDIRLRSLMNVSDQGIAYLKERSSSLVKIHFEILPFVTGDGLSRLILSQEWPYLEQLKYIKMDTCDSALEPLSTHCPLLQVLVTDQSKISDKGVGFALNNKYLRELDISGSRMGYLTKSFSNQFSEAQPQCLTVLRMNRLPILTDKHVSVVLQSCQSLQMVFALGCDNLLAEKNIEIPIGCVLYTNSGAFTKEIKSTTE